MIVNTTAERDAHFIDSLVQQFSSPSPSLNSSLVQQFSSPSPSLSLLHDVYHLRRYVGLFKSSKNPIVGCFSIALRPLCFFDDVFFLASTLTGVDV